MPPSPKTNRLRRSSFRKRRQSTTTVGPAISIYNSPRRILWNFFLYLIDLSRISCSYLLANFKASSIAASLCCFALALYYIDGPHQPAVLSVVTPAQWYIYWIMLGIASSIGLGTGLHTFVLFLGPFIAETTVAANQCGSLDFDTRGPNKFLCPTILHPVPIPVWRIFSKVKLECFFWGLGTAIGELPPYFMARAAALSGRKTDDLQILQEIQEKRPSARSIKEKFLMIVYILVQKIGFWGIFLCASIPNPLFDLAGITCGHFLVPFWTFFGATLLGKALVKTSLQALCVTVLFLPDVLNATLQALKQFSPAIHSFVEKAVAAQLAQFTTADDPEAAGRRTGIFGKLWNGFLTLTLLYFALSIIESLALAKIEEKEREKAKANGGQSI